VGTTLDSFCLTKALSTRSEKITLTDNLDLVTFTRPSSQSLSNASETSARESILSNAASDTLLRDLHWERSTLGAQVTKVNLAMIISIASFLQDLCISTKRITRKWLR
jgi:hypothetical protein